MFIGELAAASNISVQAVRLYERRGLMRPPRRTAAGYRVYEASDLEILTAIRQCQRFGLTLRETRQVLSLYAVPPPNAREPAYQLGDHECLREVAGLARTKLAATEAKIAELSALRTEMAELLGRLDERLADLKIQA
jgi:DNA-binding transcriptional MerR regulator